ncbi:MULTISPECIES: MFS transporter [Pantoea]|jgi:OFA family oxalate/formate antiporter-like MFS transporter|uniref:MFS transporter, OFA family, oxalate/formate antiporter n=1 Tax=Candidatus Pantoea symbiotica TaxID=1884370 RepID=A0A1I3WJR1_9GAMM|nr:MULTISPECIES: MFS transporter [Pantoea]MRT23182.1 oxalate/formate antiport family MFS transporter [Enterobacteriaceae bacterium RIT697]MRT41982.1 oxalate/formate antiport family MFS transporter [Enterobacteriaceae bacterium RIT702]KAJ9432321.1 MFS transporter [Pantoea sp. YR343]UVC28260.1 MFS transporter [Pantoea sp. SOD02]SFK07087.1 MFS transporter, OFA family, oxalate/formate antiporter [Pantoea symbiotica]
MTTATPANYQRTRTLTLIGTIITQFALGSVYTWSLFNGPLANKLDAPISEVAFSFGLLSLGLAIASSLAGKLQERFGVRNVTIGAGILMAVGFWLTAHADNLMMLYLSAGILVGLADGAGYLMTLSNCVKWFPERKGLISACSIGAYGLGSLGFKFICGALLSAQGLENTFMIWGVLAMSMIIVGALLMRDAPMQKSSGNAQLEAKDYTLAQSVRLPQYWMLALMFLTACMSGLYVIGVAKDIGEGMVHLSAQTAANAVTVIAIANLSGRLILGVLSDKMARIRVITLAQIVSLVGMSILLFTHMNESTFFLSLACVAFSFGGTITVFPSLVSDFFGLNNLTKNYGLIYLGFGIGSVLGSLVASAFGGFTVTFSLIMTLLVISLVLSLSIRLPNRQNVAEPLLHN